MKSKLEILALEHISDLTTELTRAQLDAKRNRDA